MLRYMIFDGVHLLEDKVLSRSFQISASQLKPPARRRLPSYLIHSCSAGHRLHSFNASHLFCFSSCSSSFAGNPSSLCFLFVLMQDVRIEILKWEGKNIRGFKSSSLEIIMLLARTHDFGVFEVVCSDDNDIDFRRYHRNSLHALLASLKSK